MHKPVYYLISQMTQNMVENVTCIRIVSSIFAFLKIANSLVSYCIDVAVSHNLKSDVT